LERRTFDGLEERRGLIKRRLRLLVTVVGLSMVFPPLFSHFCPHTAFVIASDSMMPTLKPGDILITRPVDGEILNGTIVVFESPLGGFEAHRIVGRVATERGVYYMTRGDANKQEDSFLIPEGNVLGASYLVVPDVGMYFLVPREIALVATLGLIGTYVFLTFRKGKEVTIQNSTLGQRINKKIRVLKNACVIVNVMLLSSIPYAQSSLSLIYPADTKTVSVATPKIVLENGIEGSSMTGDQGNTATVSVATPVWLAGWTYRKSHVVNPSSGAGTNYQIRIKVNYGGGTDGGEDVYLNGKCRIDFGDIRFAKSDGATLLDYWMETKIDGSYAVFWVEISDDLDASPVAIYIYYGKSDATRISNGTNTFVYFDDFNGSLSQWTVISGTWSTEGGVLKATAGTGRLGLYITGSSLSNAAVDAKITVPVSSADAHSLGTYYRGDGTLSYTNAFFRFYWHLANNRWELKTGSTFVGTNTSLSPEGATKRISSRFYGASHNMYVEDSLVINVASSLGTSPGKVGVNVYNIIANNYLDDFRVRKYVNPEPSHGSWGGEEASYESYDYVLKVSNQGINVWSIFLTESSDSNIARLSNLTIWFHDGSGISKQIQVIDGSYTQTSGGAYSLPPGGTVYIAIAAGATSSDASSIVARLRAMLLSSGVSEELTITFNVN